MSATEIVAAATAGGEGEFGATAGRLPVTLFAPGLAGAETVDIQISQDGGSTFTDVYQNGAQVQLDATNNVISLFGPGHYKAVKSATSASVGVYLSEKDRK